MSIWEPGFKLFWSYLSANIKAEDLDVSYTSIRIYELAGSKIGRKFNERGLIGTIIRAYTLLYKIGPDKLIFLPIDPRGVDIMRPSPQRLAKW